MIERDRPINPSFFDELISLELPYEALEASARSISEWRSLGDFEGLGSYDLSRRVFVSILEALKQGTKSKK